MYIAAFLSLGNHLSAQNWSIGPIAGVNVTNIDIDAPEGQNFESRPGFAGGLVVNYSDIEHFGASVNFLFSQYGGQVDGTDSKTWVDSYFCRPLISSFPDTAGQIPPSLFRRRRCVHRAQGPRRRSPGPHRCCRSGR